MEFAPGTAENQTCDSQTCSEVLVPAGLDVLKLQLRSPDDAHYAWGTQPQLLIVKDYPEELTKQSARRGGCVDEVSRAQGGPDFRLLPPAWGAGVDAVVQNGNLDPSSMHLGCF